MASAVAARPRGAGCFLFGVTFATAYLAVPATHLRFSHPEPVWSLPVAVASGTADGRPVAGFVRRLAHRSVPAGDGLRMAGPAVAVAGSPALARAHHRLVVSVVVAAVRAAGGVHAAVHP